MQTGDQQRITVTWHYDVRWPKAPLSAEKVFADPHYRKWAREYFGDRAVARLMLETLKAAEGEYQRDTAIKVIARSFGVVPNTVKNAIGRSSKVVAKRRQKRIQHI